MGYLSSKGFQESRFPSHWQTSHVPTVVENPPPTKEDVFAKKLHQFLMAFMLVCVSLIWVGFVLNCFDIATRSMEIARHEPGLGMYCFYYGAASVGPVLALLILLRLKGA